MTPKLAAFWADGNLPSCCFFMNPCYSPSLQLPAFLDFYSMRSSVEVNRAVSEWKRTQLAVLLGMAVKAVLCVNLNGTGIA